MAKRPSRLSESLAPYLASESSGVTKLSISLSNDLAEDVRRTAEESGTTVSATIAAAIRRARDAEVRSDPEDLLQRLIPARQWFGLVALAKIRDQSLEDVLVEAVSPWLREQGMLLASADEARRVYEKFRAEQVALNRANGWTDAEIEADVDAAVKEVRAARNARRR